MMTGIEKSDGRSAADGLSLRDLRSFVAVARAGGVTRAARELGYAQATLSAHLAALESAIGVPLLEPGRRGAILTEAGRRVLGRADALLQAASALPGFARSAADRVTIRLAACEPVASFRLPPILAAFERRRPEVHVELRVAGHVMGPDLVASGACALAIVPRPMRAHGPALSFTRLYQERMMVFLPGGHRLASATSVALGDLRGESVLVGSDVCAYRALVVGALDESDVDVALRARFGDGTTLVHGVAAGLGVAVLPEGFMRGSVPRGVVALPLLRPRIALDIGLVQARDRATDGEPLRALRRAIGEGLRAGGVYSTRSKKSTAKRAVSA